MSGAASKTLTTRLRRLRSQSRPPLSAATGLLARATTLAGARVGTAVWQSEVTGPELVAGYAQGGVLFGRPGSRHVPLEWRTFELRSVITPETARVPPRLRSIARREGLVVRFDDDFDAILELTRQGRTGWLTPAAVAAYRRAHALGFGSTVGAYRDGELVGGLWGIAVGGTFGIMSMFHLERHSGTIPLTALVNSVLQRRRWTLIDCGVPKEHFTRYGAFAVSTARFCELVWQGMRCEAPAAEAIDD